MRNFISFLLDVITSGGSQLVLSFFGEEVNFERVFDKEKRSHVRGLNVYGDFSVEID